MLAALGGAAGGLAALLTTPMDVARTQVLRERERERDTAREREGKREEGGEDPLRWCVCS
jgi:hypothetical protein